MNVSCGKVGYNHYPFLLIHQYMYMDLYGYDGIYEICLKWRCELSVFMVLLDLVGIFMQI